MERALAFCAVQGIEVRRLFTDNDSPCLSRAFRAVTQERDLAHLRTRPYRPQANRKTEAFVKPAQNGWAHRRPYAGGAERITALDRSLVCHNRCRPHGGPSSLTPMQRSAL